MRGSAWRHWNWLEDGGIPLVSAAARVAWMTPLVHVILNNPLVAPRGTNYPAWLILLLLLAASSLRHRLQDHLQGPTLIVVAGLLAVVGALAFHFRTQSALFPLSNAADVVISLTDFQQGIPASLVVLLITGVLWRRGLTIDWESYGEFWRDFLSGTIILGLLMALPGSVLGDLSLAKLWGICASFVVTGLLALGLLGVLDTLVFERVRGSVTPPLSRYWLMAVGSVVLAIIVIGWAVGQILSPETVVGVWRALTPLTHFLGQILEYILTGVVYLLALLLIPLFNALKARFRLSPEPLRPQQPKPLEQLPPVETVLRLSPSLLLILRISLLLAILAGMILAFLLVWQRRQSRSKDDVSEQRELIWSKELLLRQLRDLLRRRPSIESPLLFLELPQPEEPRQVIRLLYQRLLARARDLGYARPPGLTPTGYQRLLLGLIPGQRAALATLTAMYLLARYAPEAPGPEEVTKAQQAIVSIEEALSPMEP